MKYFGSSGIRGVVNKTITPDLALNVGKALGKEYSDVVIGRDTRPSGDMVKSAIIAGLTSLGADVKDAGMLSTPALAYATRDFDCGVMVTASHNPAPYNGIKLWNPDGSSFDTAQMEKTERDIDEDHTLPEWDKIGNVESLKNATRDHIDAILSKFDRDHDLKVVVDCANGGAYSSTPYLLEKMGCEVITLNAQPDGTFPAHDPEPVEENLVDLSKTVKKTNADLGIAHDGDGDRMVAFDSDGNYLGGDTLLSLFASRFDKVVVPVNSSMVIEELSKDVIRTRVGDVFVAEKLKESGADFGGEPSGTWIYPGLSYAPDGIYAAALLVNLTTEIDLKKTIKELPSYTRRKKAYKVTNKQKTMDELISLYQKEYDQERIDLIDGIRLNYENGWALTRASGTEPKIRITVEATNDVVIAEIFEEVENKLKKVIR